MLGLLALDPSEAQAVRDFPLWNNPQFVVTFIVASLMGSILNYATFLCTVTNSALTTTVIGCLKVCPFLVMGVLLSSRTHASAPEPSEQLSLAQTFPTHPCSHRTCSRRTCPWCSWRTTPFLYETSLV